MKHLSYKELYERSIGVELIRMETAVEIYFVIENLTDEQYEEICEFAYNVYLKSEDVTLNQIANTIDFMLNDGKTVEEITDMNYWDFLSEAIL